VQHQESLDNDAEVGAKTTSMALVDPDCSFFDTQHGDFKLTLLEIRAMKGSPPKDLAMEDDASLYTVGREKDATSEHAIERPTVWQWLLGRCGRL
jgi:hypothetical protein